MSAHGPRGVAVFGSSEALSQPREFERARRIGALLARSGVALVCGGYGGVMEAASLGAREEGGMVIGVTCAAFKDRQPNRYLSEIVEEPDLFSRTSRLMALSRGFIILPGKSGTLAELTFLWALRRAGLLGERPIVLLGEQWPELLDVLVKTHLLEANALSATVLAQSEEEAVAESLGDGGAGGAA